MFILKLLLLGPPRLKCEKVPVELERRSRGAAGLPGSYKRTTIS